MKQKNMKHFYSLCILSCALCMILLSGCGKNQPLSGKITFADDGSPLTCGVVVFRSGSFEARGNIKPDGTYIVGSESEADGIPIGSYTVYILNAFLVKGMNEKTLTAVTEPLLDAKYENPSMSGLTFTADGKTKVFNFKVDRAKKK